MLAMRFSLTTWNINSVRLRIDLVAKFLKSMRPDVLCLQETKCIDDAFPLKRFKRLGYEHVALNGQKGYHGVAVISKLPFETTDIRTFCDKIDSRHISVQFGERAQLSKPLVLHNFYVPAGGEREAERGRCGMIAGENGRLRIRPIAERELNGIYAGIIVMC